MHRNSHRNQTKEATGAVAEHAHALLEATKDAADERIGAVRERLSAALAAARETYESVEEYSVEKVKEADKYVRANPYQTAAIALGLGAVLGYLFSRRNRD